METLDYMRDAARTDPSLTAAEQDRTDAAFAAMYVTNRDYLYRYLSILTGHPDVAADLVSESFARGLIAWRAGRLPADRPLPWLLLTGRRLATDRWRRLRTAFRTGARRLRGQDVEVDLDSRLWLSEICAHLPKRQREVVALRYVRDLSDREIGHLMGLSESGVRSLAARAIKTLRKHPEVWR